MNSFFRKWRCCLVTLTLTLTVPGRSAAQDDAPWKVALQKNDLTVLERPRKGTELREFKAIGTIAVAPEVVRRVLDDVPSYPNFMPYVVEARILSEEAKGRVTYQRISPPLVSDRDYTVKVRFETRRTPDGNVYVNRWQSANELGPAPRKGITRVTVTEGYWQLEPLDGGRATRATYFIYSDSGGALPIAVLNSGSRTAIPRIFEGVRRQTRLEKYQGKP